MEEEEECANPLLLAWVDEWLETARKYNSKGVTTYKKAYDSIKACPIAFSHPSEAQQLHGLGPKLCDRLTDRLKAHCAENGLPIPEMPYKGQKRQTDEGVVNGGPRKSHKPKPYVPTLRSGPYAILLALATIPEDSSNGLTKVETIELAQPHCDSSFSAPSEPGKFYTAWNSIKTLIAKELVYERGRPLRKYALTEEGWEVAKRIKNVDSNGKIPGTLDQFVNQSERADSAADDRDARKQKSDLGNQRDSLQKIETENIDLSFDHDASRRMPGNASSKPPSEPQMTDARSGKERGADDRTLIDTRSGAPVRATKSHFPQAEFVTLSSSPPGSKSPTATEKSPGLRPAMLRPQLSVSNADLGNARMSEEERPGFAPIILASNTFSVHLVLDNREIRAKQDRDYFQDELTRRGVKPIMRSLDCGDALWVAKHSDPHYLGKHGEEGDEVVLDYIVERKRLDDLVDSIKDGRFHEQKFRLRKSGVKNVIYIIEEISKSSEAISKYQEAVDSAIASTQVVNGFFVKRTQKLDDTIRYLARMTATLKSSYENQVLPIIPTRQLTPQNYLSLLSSFPTQHYITYSAFASLASKSDSLTLRDLFLKMLMCTRGVTGDKALAIQRHWNTPRGFIEAFEDAATAAEGQPSGTLGVVLSQAEKDLVFKELGNLVGRRKVGKALSGKIAEVWSGR